MHSPMKSATSPLTEPQGNSVPMTGMWYSHGHQLWGDPSLTIDQVSEKHKRVGELLRELRTCDPSVVLTDEQRDQEYWTSQAMMRPGLEVAKLEAHLLTRKAEFSTPVAKNRLTPSEFASLMKDAQRDLQKINQILESRQRSHAAG